MIGIINVHCKFSNAKCRLDSSKKFKWAFDKLVSEIQHERRRLDHPDLDEFVVVCTKSYELVRECNME